MDWPIYFKERLWLGNAGGGFVGVATLWTPKERIIEVLDEDARKKVAVVGQLYTKRGSEYIFRNVWANPKIRYLIITGTDLTNSGDLLCKRQKNELEKMFEGVEKEYFEDFFEKLEVIDMRGKGVDKVLEKIKSLEYEEVGAREPVLFPESKPQGGEKPSENSVFRIEGETIGEAWIQILSSITNFGRKVPRINIYGGFERVLLNVSVVVTAENIKEPKMWPFFDFDKEQLKGYFKNFFTPERREEAYTYGERLFAYEVDGKIVDQVSEMVKKMKSFPFNKGALGILWQAGIDNFPIRKPWRTPCLTLIQGFCVEDKFYLTAYFRSNDMFGAWPQNAFALRKLQTEIAVKLGKRVGDLTTISHCAFIDESDLVKAERILKENNRLFCKFDPRGNLVIEVVGEEIVIKQYSPDSKLLAEYRQNGREAKAALRMAEKLQINNVISTIGHALDIGEQLGRAEDAIKLGKKFIQDRDLL